MATSGSGESGNGCVYRAVSSHPSSLFELHESVVQGDENALDQLAAFLLKTLPRILRRRFPRAPAEWMIDAVEDVILDYARRPTAYDPTRRVSLERFLVPAAVRNLSNRIERERRLKQREEGYAVQERLFTHTVEPSIGEADIAARLRGKVLAITRTEAEARALLWMLKPAPSVARLAEILGVTDCPIEEQRREIKRFRDRIVKRLGRLAAGSPRRGWGT
jgi:RNA polymerase sigma-70 factor (ECF subfamily)